MASELKLQFLGGLFITQNGVPLGPFISNKVPALMAYLAVTGRPHTREALTGLLWGDLAEADAKNNLRQALTNLRKLAEPHFIIQRDIVEFNAHAIYSLDLESFEQKARSSELADLEAAAELYTGDFLAGFFVRDAPEFEEWMLAHRARWRALALNVWQTLTQHHLAHGNYRSAIETASQLLALEAWREEAHRQLMLALARSGQRSAALAQYETCRRLLEKELEVEPAVETTALYDRLRLAQRAARHNLPTSTTTFIGRTDELTELQHRLANPACRLLTLTGPGGVGKTRLALQTASSLAEVFINGVWYAPLTTARAETLVYDLAEALQLTLKTGDPKKQLLNFLKPQELLLVLDNFEHVLAAVPILMEIIQTAPAVKILVTSRERLNLQSEWVFELTGLAVPPKATDPTHYSAAQLFLHSVARQRPRFQSTPNEWAAIHTICHLLEGLPLGIELAAGQMGELDCARLAAEITRGMDFLATTQHDVPERQRSLRALVESAWRQLSTQEQAVFARLAIFRGSFTAQAAKAVAGATSAQLAVFVAKSLVRRTLERYELHEVLRHFAAEKNTQRVVVEAQHAAYYAAWLSTTYRGAAGPTGEGVNIHTIAGELGNLHAAWQWASTYGHSVELEQMRPGLYRFFEVRGHYRAGEELFAQASATMGISVRLSHALTADRAMFLVQLGQLEQASALFEQCLAFFQQADEPQQLVFCLNGLGTIARSAGQYVRAEHYITEQLRVAQAAGLRWESASALNNLGIVFDSQGKYTQAIQVHRQCLALRRELGDELGVASSLINLNVALTNSGDFSQAEALLTEALAISREFNDARRTAAVLTNLGAVAKRAGQLQTEKAYYQQALALHEESGFRLGVALAFNNLGSVTCRMGEWAEARRYLHTALSEARAGKFEFVTLDALSSIALLWFKEGRTLPALEVLALPLYHPAADGETVAAAQKLLIEFSATQSPSVVKAALERGQAQALSEVVTAILTEPKSLLAN